MLLLLPPTTQHIVQRWHRFGFIFLNLKSVNAITPLLTFKYFPNYPVAAQASEVTGCFRVSIYSHLRGNLCRLTGSGRCGGQELLYSWHSGSFCWFIIRREPRAPTTGRSERWGGSRERRRGRAGARLMDTKWTNYDGPLWAWWGQMPCAPSLTVQFPPNAAPFADC